MRNFLPLFCAFLTISFNYSIAQNVCIFTDLSYVDYNVGDCEAEASNAEQQVIACGATPSQITSIGGFSAALPTCDILLLPEIEYGNFISDISPTELAAIQNYLTNGGVVFLMGGSYIGINQATDILNVLGGFSTSGTNMDSGTSELIAGATTGTCLDGSAAASLPNHSGTHLIITSLPAGSTCVYKDAGQTSVAYIPVGSGEIRYFGWDYYEGGPGCSTEDAGWNTVFCCFLEQLTQPSPVPALSTWGIYSLALILLSFGVAVLYRRNTALQVG